MKCATCGTQLPPLNGCEGNDFITECESCEENDEDFDDDYDWFDADWQMHDMD